MRSSVCAFVIAGLLVLTGIVAVRAQEPAKQSPKAAATANADLPIIDLAGYNKILAKYRGKPLLVTFWATWCEPCRDEFPTLVQLAKEYGPKGLAVFGVSLDDNADMNLVRHFLTEFRPGFSNYRQNPQIDVDEFYRGVNPSWQGSMPETIFYSRDGRIAQSFTAEQTRATFDQAIRAILATQASSKQFDPSAVGG
jgi:thiol-disulfide isomerase/thioredoxin